MGNKLKWFAAGWFGHWLFSDNTPKVDDSTESIEAPFDVEVDKITITEIDENGNEKEIPPEEAPFQVKLNKITITEENSDVQIALKYHLYTVGIAIFIILLVIVFIKLKQWGLF